jgi:tRNA(fMet)-specific endonuclease VapC
LGSLIDSSIFIAAERGDPALRSTLALLVPEDGDLFVSAVPSSNFYTASTAPRPRRERPARRMSRTPSRPSRVWSSTNPARIFASIDAALSAAGSRLAVEDLMIAATALAGGHDVITRDLRSFPRVPGLKWTRW